MEHMHTCIEATHGSDGGGALIIWPSCCWVAALINYPVNSANAHTLSACLVGPTTPHPPHAVTTVTACLAPHNGGSLADLPHAGAQRSRARPPFCAAIRSNHINNASGYFQSLPGAHKTGHCRRCYYCRCCPHSLLLLLLLLVVLQPLLYRLLRLGREPACTADPGVARLLQMYEASAWQPQP